MRARSGEQFLLENGQLSVVVTSVGATLRSFSVGDRPILVSFGEDEISPFGRGQVLAPWPNRLEDGSYRVFGIDAKAALDEPERHNAIHGLVRWISWSKDEHSAHRLRLSCPLAAQPGYPFLLGLSLLYELSDSELSVTFEANNFDEQLVPFAIGFHPYFATPLGADRARLSIPASTHLVTNERGLPVGSEPLSASVCERFAVRDGSVVGDLALDDCFTDLLNNDERGWRVELQPDASRPERVVLAADALFTHLMCFTGDTLPASERRRAIALEPMTAPPNAFRRGDYARLEPEERLVGTFTIGVSSLLEQ